MQIHGDITMLHMLKQTRYSIIYLQENLLQYTVKLNLHPQILYLLMPRDIFHI